jgi:predicted porin
VSSITPSTSDLDDRGWAVSAAYTWGPVRVGGFYMDRKWDQPDGDVKAKSVSAGVEWNIAGPHNLHFNYNWLDDAEGSSLLGIEATSQGGIQAPNAIVNGVRQSRSDTGAQSFSIAYQYNFSKRTSAKIGYTLMDNDSNSRSARLGTAPSVINAGDDQSAFALVVKHRF